MTQKPVAGRKTRLPAGYVDALGKDHGSIKLTPIVIKAKKANPGEVEALKKRLQARDMVMGK
jgi:hypothetical protein